MLDMSKWSLIASHSHILCNISIALDFDLMIVIFNFIPHAKNSFKKWPIAFVHSPLGQWTLLLTFVRSRRGTISWRWGAVEEIYEIRALYESRIDYWLLITHFLLICANFADLQPPSPFKGESPPPPAPPRPWPRSATQFGIMIQRDYVNANAMKKRDGTLVWGIVIWI